MGLTNEHVGPKILAKIKIYVLTRAELLFQVCYEIPCTSSWLLGLKLKFRYSEPRKNIALVWKKFVFVFYMCNVNNLQ